jgi:hypothetical protein
VTITTTRSELQEILDGLRLTPNQRGSVARDLDFLANMARGGGDREFVLGPKLQAALDRVINAERGVVGSPRGL